MGLVGVREHRWRHAADDAMGKAEEDLHATLQGWGVEAIVKLNKAAGVELCLEKLREFDGDVNDAVNAILDMEGKDRPGPAKRMQKAREGPEEMQYGEDLLGAFVLDQGTAVRVAKDFYKKKLSPAGPNSEVDKPVEVRCNSPSTLVWSMLFGSLVTEEPRWYRFEFEPKIIFGQPEHLLCINEVRWEVKDYSESGVSMRNVKRPLLSKRTAAALAKEWYEDVIENAYGQHYRIMRQPDSKSWYKTMYAECPAKTLLKVAELDHLRSAARKSFEHQGITDVMFLVHLMGRQDAHPGKAKDGTSQLTEALKKRCGITKGRFYDTEDSAEKHRREIEAALQKMPHIWTMVFDAVPIADVRDDRGAMRPAGMVLRDCSLKFECSCEPDAGYEHDGLQWTVKRIIDPFEHLQHHVKARASAVDQRADLADEHELLKAKLGKAPPPSVVEAAEQKRVEVLREARERFNARSFLLGTHTRQKMPSKKQNEEMLEEAKEAYLEYLEEWADEQAKEMEKHRALTLGVKQDQSVKETREGKVDGRAGRKTLGRGNTEPADPVPESEGEGDDHVRVHTSLQGANIETVAGREKLGLERKRNPYGKKAPVYTMKATRDFTEGSTWADEQVPHEHWQEPIRWTGKTAQVRDGLDGRHRTAEIGLAHQPQLHDGQGSRERRQWEHRGMSDGDLVCMRDLEFKKDDLIQVTNAKGRWFEGYRKADPEHRIGRFPSTYVTEYYEKLTRYISVTIFSVHETRTEFEKHASRVGKVVSKAGKKGADVAESSFSSPSVIGLHACDDETGMTATVKVGKPGKWSPEDGEATKNPVEFVDQTAEFGNAVSGHFESEAAPLRVDRRGETITVKQKVGVQTLHHAAEDTMPAQEFSALIEWDDDSSHHLDENFGLMLSECGHIMGFIGHEHGGPVSMAGLAKYSRVVAIDGRPVDTKGSKQYEHLASATVTPKDAILDILDDINARGGLASVRFHCVPDALPVGWEAQEIDIHGKVHYRYVDVLSGHTEEEWPTPAILKKMKNQNEYKKTGLCYSVPKFVHVEVTRESRPIGKGKDLVDVKVGEVQIEVKSILTELENLRLLYTRLKEEQLKENSSKQDKAEAGLRKFEPAHHELQREAEKIQDKRKLADTVFGHIAHKDLHSKRGGVMMSQLQQQRIRDELDEMSMHELREAAITHGVPVEMTMDHHVDRKGVADMGKYQQKVNKQETQLKLLKKKIEDLETKLATPTWYRLERNYDKQGGYVWGKGKWERKDPNARGPRGNTMPLWSAADVGHWLTDEVAKKEQFGISPIESKGIASALKAQGIDGRKLGKLDEQALKALLPTALQGHAANVTKAVEAEANDPKQWGQESRFARLNHIDSQFENDPPAWVKLSIAVSPQEPEDETPVRVQHHGIPTLDAHHFHMDRAHSKETKSSMFLRACCGKPEATDKRGRPTTRREHARRVAAARTADPPDIVMIVQEGQSPGFKLDDELFVKGKVDDGSVAKEYGVLQGMYLYAFKPNAKPLMVLGSISNDGIKNGCKWSDVHKLIAKHKDDTPHEYHFRVDRYGDRAKEMLKRQGVWVKGYGYAPVGGEPVDVVNAIRDKLYSSTMVLKDAKAVKAKYTEFLEEARRITTEMLDTSKGLPLGTQLTDPLRYSGDTKGSIAAIFQELDHPFGKSAVSLLDERNYQPKTLAQILLYWLDRQVHNASEPGAKSDLQPGIVGLTRFEPWSQKVKLDRIVGTITPVEFERAIEDVTHAVGCTTKCEITSWKQTVTITNVPIAAATLESGEGNKQLRAGLAVAHGLGQTLHRGSLHHGQQRKYPADQVTIESVTPNSRTGARGAAIGSDVRYSVVGDMIHVQRGQSITLSSKALADALSDAGGPLPELDEDDFIAQGPVAGISKLRCQTSVTFTLTGSTKAGRASVSRMREALPERDANGGARAREALDRVKAHLNRSVIETRTLTGKLRIHTGVSSLADEITEIDSFEMDGDPQVKDEVKPYVDAFLQGGPEEHYRFRSFIYSLQEPSRSTLRGLVFLIRDVMKYAMDNDQDEFNGKCRRKALTHQLATSATFAATEN